MGIDQRYDVQHCDPKSRKPNLIVVGNGPVGVHFVRQLIKYNYEGHITIIGEEAYQPYNRVLLSSFLNGEVKISGLNNTLEEHPWVTQECHCRIVEIDYLNKHIVDSQGTIFRFDILVLATGSSAFIPNIKGKDKPGVFRFRDIKDAEALYARQMRSRHTVVIGGGLLGLETAKAMLKHSTKVTVIHHGVALMNRQLDATASKMVQTYAEQLGIHFELNCQVHEILGVDKVESISLATGEEIACDTVIFTTGIKPNIQLALDAKIHVRKGIQIDETLGTNINNIYAIGECADYQGQVYGLVAPGLEQASTLALNLCGGQQRYLGSKLVTELKVLGLTVFSMGKVSDEYANQIDTTNEFNKNNTYRRLLFSKKRLVGAVAIGPWSEIKPLQSAIEQSTYLYPWQRLRFSLTGKIFGDDKQHLLSYPDTTIVCNCQQVSVGQLRERIRLGETQFSELKDSLGVSTVCGTCQPLIESALDQPATKLPIKSALLSMAVIALFVVCTYIFLPTIPIRDSVQQMDWSWLWTNSQARQTSGFTILGLLLFSLVLSVRKRFASIQWFSFEFWRYTHTALTLVAIGVLFLHTGTSFGDGLNRLLAINFTAIVFVGIASAIASSCEGRVVNPQFKRFKRYLVYSHIFTFWPLPILLAFHILSVYYF